MAIYENSYEDAKHTIAKNWINNKSKPNLFAYVQIKFGKKYMIDYTETYIRSGIEVIEKLIYKVDDICVEADKAEWEKEVGDTETIKLTINQDDLHSAVDSGDIQRVKTIIKSGVDINCFDERGTPLHVAVALTTSNPDMIELLLDAGADINAQQPIHKGTALHMAVLRKDQTIVRLLVSRGADLTIRNMSGKTPYEMATDFGYTHVIDILRPNSSKALAPRNSRVLNQKKWWQFWR